MTTTTVRGAIRLTFESERDAAYAYNDMEDFFAGWCQGGRGTVWQAWRSEDGHVVAFGGPGDVVEVLAAGRVLR